MDKRFFAGEAVEPVEAEGIREIDFQWGVKIPLRDGVQLNATLFKPKDPAPVPVIFTLTPYIADNYTPRGLYFARHGYAFAAVDVRGRGNSGGVFEPIVQEPPDGHDVCEWLAAQPWCDGQVTMWGGSYGGYDQWMTLKEFPPHLKTIVPVASAHSAWDFPFQKNFFYPYEMQWLTFTSGATGNAALFGEPSFWIDKFQELVRSGRPFVELDQIVGNPSTVWQTWMQHPTPDAYWNHLWISSESYTRLDLPILTITGHYDADQYGAMKYYQDHMLHGSASGKAQHYLIIGPWDHAGTRTPAREFGGRKFAEAMMIDMNALHVAWYDWTLKGGPKPEFLKDRVACYVMGAEEWRYAPDLESLTVATRRLYLSSTGGAANDVFHSGELSEQAPLQGETSQPDQYRYDPLDLRFADLEKEDVKDYLVDQRYELNLFGQGLVYHSEPFEQDTEITGFVRLSAWIALDQPDTDFRVLLALIAPDGAHVVLSDDQMRARYRLSRTEEKLVTPGAIEEYVFDGFTFFSQLVSKGSRLRLVLRAVDTIFLERNYNAGGEVARESAADARTVTVQLYHDAEHPSCLEIPIGARPGK